MVLGMWVWAGLQSFPKWEDSLTLSKLFFFFFKPKIRLTLKICFPFENLQFDAHAISPNKTLGA